MERLLCVPVFMYALAELLTNLSRFLVLPSHVKEEPAENRVDFVRMSCLSLSKVQQRFHGKSARHCHHCKTAAKLCTYNSNAYVANSQALRLLARVAVTISMPARLLQPYVQIANKPETKSSPVE